MAAPSPNDVLTDVAGAFGLDDPGQLAGRWTGIAIFAAQQATTAISTILYGKNWSAAQVAASPDAGNWMRTYALFLALSRGGPPANFTAESLKALNCVEQVRDYANVTDPNGNPIVPDGTSQVGRIISGTSAAAQQAAARTARRNLGYGGGYGGYSGGCY